jgi:hypothetical protein
MENLKNFLLAVGVVCMFIAALAAAEYLGSLAP